MDGPSIARGRGLGVAREFLALTMEVPRLPWIGTGLCKAARPLEGPKNGHGKPKKDGNGVHFHPFRPFPTLLAIPKRSLSL